MLANLFFASAVCVCSEFHLLGAHSWQDVVRWSKEFPQPDSDMQRQHSEYYSQQYVHRPLHPHLVIVPMETLHENESRHWLSGLLRFCVSVSPDSCPDQEYGEPAGNQAGHQSPPGQPVWK